MGGGVMAPHMMFSEASWEWVKKGIPRVDWDYFVIYFLALKLSILLLCARALRLLDPDHHLH
jgi:hypothetical protein